MTKSSNDYTETTESTVDVFLLPEVIQVKNFDKRSRIKYTHLLDQDTTQRGFGGVDSVKVGDQSTEREGYSLYGGPHLKKGKDRVLKLRRAPIKLKSYLANLPQNLTCL